jgi:hypothetical protein
LCFFCTGFDSMAAIHPADHLHQHYRHCNAAAGGGFGAPLARTPRAAYYLMPPSAAHCGGSSGRPITVRSVKRRDRGKSLERRGVIGAHGGGGGGISVIGPASVAAVDGAASAATTAGEEEERAVMV